MPVSTASIVRLPPWRSRPFGVFVSKAGFVVLAVAGVAVAFALSPESVPLTNALVLAVSTGAAMHTRMAIGRWQAAVQIVLGAVIPAAFGAPPRLVVLIMVTGLAASVLIARCTRRTEVVRAGLWTALIAGVASGSGLAATVSLPWEASLREALGAAVGGFASAPLMLTFGPLMEWVSGQTTRLTMSEWLNYEHPLLRTLASAAPGTFQHSINVGVLADAAARAIGADPLLARVGGLYHDVGKTRAPEFFAENQHDVNPHDRLAPAESARIFRAHVTDGVELVLSHRLGHRIVDFVREHHGTSRMRSLAPAVSSPSDATPVEDPYCYPGPKPRSAETAIVMIADQLEATARAAPPADDAACDDLVRTAIARIRDEGQLEDSGIAASSLALLMPAFSRALGGMHHRRVSYPAAAPPPARFRILRPRRRRRS